MRLHVVGNACIDTTFRLARFPQPGETLNASSHADGIGGKGANQAVAAARTGIAVSLWAPVGDDHAGAFIAARMAAELDSRLRVLDLPTDRSTIIVDGAGENLIVTGAACAEAFDPLRDTAFGEAIAAGDIVVLQGNLTDAVTNACLAMARRQDAFTIFNPSPLRPANGFDFASVDLAIVNEGEAAALTGECGPEAAARALARRGAGSVVVTLGASGCLIVEGQTVERIAAPRVAVVDTSGAGDVFCGCLAGCLGQGKTLRQAARVAVAAAAISVGRAGTLDSCPSRQDITEIIRTTELETA